MWKRLTGLLLALALLVGMLALPAAAAEAADPVATVQALGIMTGDQNGNMNLTKNVTRAEFCKMLVAATNYRDTVGGSGGYSLFTDVKSNHWAVEYIKVAVDNSWFMGYLDGSFRPNNPIKLEEAATVALRVLGYTNEDLAGSYPTAQLSKFNALGLHAGFSTGQGQYMTRMDCAWLFYNLMATNTKEGQPYGQTLGYTLDSTGHVDYGALVTAETEGPFTVSGDVTLPFAKSTATVYRNGHESTWAQVTDYDIYYYNENLRTVWVYSNRVTGTYTAATPSTVAPTSVTVGGNTYTIESSAAAYKLSAQGQYTIGDTVTLLLGMNGGVADVCDAGAAAGHYYGVVTGNSTTSYTDGGGAVTLQKTVQVFCTDGVTRSFAVSSTISEGTVVEADYSRETVVSRLNNKSITGKVNTAADRLGENALASDAEIIDTDSYGNVVRIYPSRLAGATLSSDDVLYYTLNASGAIDRLILKDVTGDTATYGLITDAVEVTAQMQVSSTYTWLINGTPKVFSSSNTVYNVDEGGALVILDGEKVQSMANLTSVNLTSVGDLTAQGGNRSYGVSEQVQVYVKSGDDYIATTLRAVQDTSRYTLTGWYDNRGYAAGGLIRVVVAREK